VFAKFPQVYQWYEYTGHLGGSSWVLAINILLFQAIKKTKLEGFSAKHFTTSLAIIIVPILVSVAIYFQHEDKGTKVNVTVVQPNVDPYTQKFSAAYFEDQWQKLTELSLSKSNAETQFIVWPETSVPGTIWLNKLDQSPSLKRVNEMLQQVPKATLITGVDAYDLYDLPETPTARKFRDGECCFDAFNSAFQIDTSGVAAVYHKSKLVPGVERMPYPQLFSFLENFALDLGGTTGSLGTQAEREIFTTKNNLKVGVAICYESVFGEFVTEYIRKGAQAIFIVTNDAWWYNTPGHKQHVVYASLRAVETRRSIARSANTGISCFVNQRGDIQQATQYETTTAINQDIYFNDEETFYVRYGDLVARIALFMAGYFLLLPYIKLIRAKRNSLR
jgi:apolipoprotein N-acyltransferase